jgi:hypothetical protein
MKRVFHFIFVMSNIYFREGLRKRQQEEEIEEYQGSNL